ncbi:hypothetical protein MKW94_002376 [Papaver nudicaule]|uniref:Histone chaperone domain-containing protein n=1 Tax=Papaver nudicaule TaxID=74823 RepID=A0AA41RWV0_PAPNU|nr:hypothetical protein [Papaver nudicaule]
MAELHDSESPKKKMEQGSDFEKQITTAMKARVGHFKDQADSLTLEGVRRLIEKDLGMETFALDVHKRFVKNCLQECFDSANQENASKSSEETTERKGEKQELTEVLPTKVSNSEDEEKTRGSPVMGLLAGDETKQNKVEDNHIDKSEKAPTEETIKNAIKKRASYFRANSAHVTLAGVRHLLEEDLKLEKNALNPFKKFVSAELDKVLQAEIAEPANKGKNKKAKKESNIKKSAKVSSDGTSDSSESEVEEVDDDDEDEEVKPKKKPTPKGKPQSSGGPKNQKRPAKETKTTSNKKMKLEEPISEGSNDANDGGNTSDDVNSQSSAEVEHAKKKKDVPIVVYGKRVEHLKSVIRSCGMSIPPSVYKRAKQAPESKRETYLIKELEDMLAKEGLSTSPSEKEIKAVRKNKERTKELEGINPDNIVSSSRRRSSFNFTMPPKPKIESEEEEGSEDEADDDDDEDDSDSNSNSDEYDEEVEESD